MDLNKITKLMMLSQSPNDHEALAALKAANKILASSKISWEEFIRGVRPREYKPPPPPPPKDEIKEMLDLVLKSMSPAASAREFIESLRDQYEDRGFLTFKQKTALRKFYDNVRNRNF